jgi:hypothetical protein
VVGSILAVDVDVDRGVHVSALPSIFDLRGRSSLSPSLSLVVVDWSRWRSWSVLGRVRLLRRS